MREQMLCIFSSPCFGVKTVYNYGHRCLSRSWPTALYHPKRLVDLQFPLSPGFFFFVAIYNIVLQKEIILSSDQALKKQPVAVFHKAAVTYKLLRDPRGGIFKLLRSPGIDSKE
jgi:hypothetical protein